MPADLRVAGGVAVDGVVAAKRGATLLARPQVHPLIAGLHALFALVAFRTFDVRNGAQMRTALIGHGYLLIRAMFYVQSQSKSTVRTPQMKVIADNEASRPRTAGE